MALQPAAKAIANEMDAPPIVAILDHGACPERRASRLSASATGDGSMGGGGTEPRRGASVRFTTYSEGWYSRMRERSTIQSLPTKDRSLAAAANVESAASMASRVTGDDSRRTMIPA